MSLAFFNQQRIQEKLRKASIGAIETDSQAGEVLSVAKNDGENISSVPQQPIEDKIEKPILDEETTTEEVKVKSKPQTKKAKQNK